MAAKKSPPIGIHHFEDFVEVARRGGVSRVAAERGGNQPAISKRLERFQHLLGVNLFSGRAPHKTLNENGTAFLPRAIAVLDAVRDALRMVDREQLMQPRRLRIGYATSPTAFFFPAETLKSFRSLHPNIELYPEEMSADDYVAKLGRGEIDVAFAVRPQVPEAELVYREFVQYRLCCAVPDGHPLSGKANVTLERVTHEKVIFLKRPYERYNRYLRSIFGDLASSLSILRCDEYESQLGLVEAGAGVAIGLYPMKRKAQHQGVKLIPIERPIWIGVGALFRANPSAPIEAMITCAETVVRNQLRKRDVCCRPPTTEFSSAIQRI
jgi:DNA-binding transcriptional LysR family regulator